MWLVSVFLACGLVFPASPSRCPEPRKPHLTSCTVFYNCVNLPGGGYVWVPSRCTEGLVFQPYLRMCVVPGDIWTCDTLSTDPTIVTQRYQTPEPINPADTSYLGYTPDSSDFSEALDSSYVIDDDATELTTEAATAYPLIEFEESHSESPQGDKSARNVSYHKQENYSLEYTHSYWRIPLPLMQKYKGIVNSHDKCLSELISRLHVYKELSTAITTGSLSVPIKVATTVSSTHRQNVSLDSHIGETQLQNDKPGEPEGNDEAQIENIAPTDSVTTEGTLQQLINGLDPDNNVIRISDNLGSHRYLTIDEYKTVSHQLKPRFVSVVACTENIRLPNRTACDRYYMCDPRTASVTDYSCPLHTAFNMNSRICDVESAKTCSIDKSLASKTFVDHAKGRDTTGRKEKESDEKPCRELGKVKDPASDSHYYICYSTSESEDVKSIRMTCPNALIFCQHKKVCTTKRLCDTS
ncbi:hypothetical protein DMN91_007684 [Ooceraea biroi]|uniref:Chitin-binding type-2 domain-containing protein n=1 Tax=Ooceraea biroi TaxID=2015173 RepID=A0A026X3A2_OOCBI|nr:uncharacterized protein LOC113562234 [Ooceraea biroi]EZA62737.1 hypothetical protein X777_07553 [Ooceraea biroi]RLU21068.1 hypothetical protein DMN91_007684 [Ooceraea biroi]